MTTVASTTQATSPAPSATSNPLTQLSSNFGQFLNLLMTQLQNQDPSSPMDANSFTSELVEFSSVAQQVSTNTNLTQLLQLTQASDTMQSAAILGKQVTARSGQLSLQNGSASLQFTAPATEPVTITVTDANGAAVSTNSVTAAAGKNTWTWNGVATNGRTMADGAYTVSVNASDGTALPFNVMGTATGVSTANNNVSLLMGGLTIPFSAVTAVTN